MALGYRSKVDTNHGSIVKRLRKCGWSVQSLASIGAGCPDLVVGVDGGYNVLMELKVHGEKLNKDQKKWHANWRGTVFTVYSPEEAEAVCRAVKLTMDAMRVSAQLEVGNG